jgi:hypothetical protein
MTIDRESTRLPAPPMLALVKMTEIEVAELIERHIEYVTPEGRPVQLPAPFVRHFMRREDNLPIVTGFSTLPIVLPNGTMLTGGGLDRKYGIIFRVPEQLDALLPTREECGAAVVVAAIDFLTDEWLVDLAADYEGKCIVIALCLTIIERMLLPSRPCFFVTAGKRGSGKTTTLQMVSRAVLGHPAAAAAWSGSLEERRKALFSYLGSGLPLLIWDNLPRGSEISCPSIEKSLTTEIYSDRVLGVSEVRRVPAYTIQCFTGNNVSPTGDLASRALIARLDAGSPDPENRTFQHADPVAWTLANRGRILQSMYQILIGNPRRGDGPHPAAETRFKEWWDMVGSAVEHAARIKGGHVSFKTLFLNSEDGEAETVTTAEVRRILHKEWHEMPFEARTVAEAIILGQVPPLADVPQDQWRRDLKAGLERQCDRALKEINATAISFRLKAMVDSPVPVDDGVLVLRYIKGAHGGTFVVKAL